MKILIIKHYKLSILFRVSKPLPLEGVLAPNNLLDNTERLFEDQIHGPENLIYHNGAIYTGVHGGELIKIVGNKFEHVAKFGKACGKSKIWLAI